jgi:serine/threonine protein kinase
MIGENNFTSKQIDTFRLITELSSGQLNSTFKAEQVQSSPRVVVFKLFHAVHLPEINRERFLQEIRLLKKVKHPHILPVLAGGFYEDSPYIVSAYAAHGSLRDRLNAIAPQFLTMQEAIAIISDIGRALQFLHQINITHRNLKPENILFNEQGEMLLADSSIVTIEDSVPVERAHNTNTFPYMAPEQFYRRTNKESDQYALGCVAFELLTGIAPFAGSAFSSMASTHTNEALVPPTQLNMLLPEYIQKAILTAMAKQETERYPHIKDFVAALAGSTRAQNAAISVPSPTTIPSSHDQYVSPLLQQSQEDSATITLQGKKPPYTPSIDRNIGPIVPVPYESIPLAQSPPVENMALPPDTPEQQVAETGDNELPTQLETNESIAEDNFFGDTIATRPNLEAVPPLNSGLTAADYRMNRVEQPGIMYGAGVPFAEAQVAPNAQHVKNNKSNWLPLSKNFVLLVGISWVLIAVLILSMVYIIIPSAHPFTHIVGPISQKSTPRPTLQPTPTTHPTAIPTVRPTPKPSPSPTPDPTPSPTVTPGPTPSPSPITIPVFTVSPTSLNGPTDCQSIPFGFKCSVTVSLPQNYPGNAHWTASSSGNITAAFVPPHGTLSPGQQQSVNIVVGKTCPHNSSFIFSTQDSKAIVSWSC